MNLEGRQVWPGLVDMHTHINTSHLLPRAVNGDGTWVGARYAVSEDCKYWTRDDLWQRMNFALRCAYVHGVSAVRTHLQSREGISEMIWSVFCETREHWTQRIELQGVSLVPIEDFGGSYGVTLANLVANCGGVLGAITRPMIGAQDGMAADLDELLDIIFRLATERSLDVDLHVDETGEPQSVALSRVAAAALRAQFKRRIVCGHCCSIALQSEDIVRPTLEMCGDAGIAVVALPMVNMYLQDRFRGRTPRWRGVTLVQELRAAGIKVAIAGDNCRDPFFAYGDHDMLETLRDSVKILHLDDPLANAPEMAGPIPAEVTRARQVGSISRGVPARLIIFNARTINEVFCRPQSDRIVLDRGRRVVDELPDYNELDAINFRTRTPNGSSLYPEIGVQARPK
jgi:cytosine deaminase